MSRSHRVPLGADTLRLTTHNSSSAFQTLKFRVHPIQLVELHVASRSARPIRSKTRQIIVVQNCWSRKQLKVTTPRHKSTSIIHRAVSTSNTHAPARRLKQAAQPSKIATRAPAYLQHLIIFLQSKNEIPIHSTRGHEVCKPHRYLAARLAVPRIIQCASKAHWSAQQQSIKADLATSEGGVNPPAPANGRRFYLNMLLGLLAATRAPITCFHYATSEQAKTLR